MLELKGYYLQREIVSQLYSVHDANNCAMNFSLSQYATCQGRVNLIEQLHALPLAEHFSPHAQSWQKPRGDYLCETENFLWGSLALYKNLAELEGNKYADG